MEAHAKEKMWEEHSVAFVALMVYFGVNRKPPIWFCKIIPDLACDKLILFQAANLREGSSEEGFILSMFKIGK